MIYEISEGLMPSVSELFWNVRDKLGKNIEGPGEGRRSLI